MWCGDVPSLFFKTYIYIELHDYSLSAYHMFQFHLKAFILFTSAMHITMPAQFFLSDTNWYKIILILFYHPVKIALFAGDVWPEYASLPELCRQIVVGCPYLLEGMCAFHSELITILSVWIFKLLFSLVEWGIFHGYVCYFFQERWYI